MKAHDSRLGKGRWRAVIITLATLGVAPDVLPQWVDGDDLHRVCSSKEVTHIFKPGVCSGYLMASIDLAEGLHAQKVLAAPLFCMPAEITMPEIEEMVITYIKKHPARKEATGSMLVLEAAQEKYPCR
jgi:hypothetical protein